MKKASVIPVENLRSSIGDGTPTARNLKRMTSEELFNVHNEILITHRGDEYRLRITRNDKLILTK